MEGRRKVADIETTRKSVAHILCTSEYRVLASPIERVLFLHGHGGVRISDISTTLDIPLSTVCRWVKSPNPSSRMGRPTYLHPSDESYLFEVLIQERYEKHTPMNNSEILEEASHSKITKI